MELEAYGHNKISIHALREEGDRETAAAWPTEAGISIHALREEGDLVLTLRSIFVLDFYPRPPRGGRRQLSSVPVALLLFLSTPSARRATRQAQIEAARTAISIHALREEGDE